MLTRYVFPLDIFITAFNQTNFETVRWPSQLCSCGISSRPPVSRPQLQRGPHLIFLSHLGGLCAFETSCYAAGLLALLNARKTQLNAMDSSLPRTTFLVASRPAGTSSAPMPQLQQL
ncbi:hypothetical protein BD779DRAFT_1802329 [Infundibulicybe gibba]|nr:hypothetical protein BD779DRAFT_1802329 [Infundibulicybe gibba]